MAIRIANWITAVMRTATSVRKPAASTSSVTRQGITVRPAARASASAGDAPARSSASVLGDDVDRVGDRHDHHHHRHDPHEHPERPAEQAERAVGPGERGEDGREPRGGRGDRPERQPKEQQDGEDGGRYEPRHVLVHEGRDPGAHRGEAGEGEGLASPLVAREQRACAADEVLPPPIAARRLPIEIGEDCDASAIGGEDVPPQEPVRGGGGGAPLQLRFRLAGREDRLARRAERGGDRVLHGGRSDDAGDVRQLREVRLERPQPRERGGREELVRGDDDHRPGVLARELLLEAVVVVAGSVPDREELLEREVGADAGCGCSEHERQGDRGGSERRGPGRESGVEPLHSSAFVVHVHATSIMHGREGEPWASRGWTP